VPIGLFNSLHLSNEEMFIPSMSRSSRRGRRTDIAARSLHEGGTCRWALSGDTEIASERSSRMSGGEGVYACAVSQLPLI
jgi:hypothetical protein